MKLKDILNEGKTETKVTKINEGQYRKLERELKALAGVVKIDFSEALEMLEEDGVLEAIDHLQIAVERIEDMIKDLKGKNNMKLTDLINEEKYTIIDPKGNPAGTGTKDQANQRQKKLGGSKKGYFVVPAKKALKARRTLEKYKFDFKSTKLQDLMSDLYFEGVNEVVNENAYKNWLKRNNMKDNRDNQSLYHYLLKKHKSVSNFPKHYESVNEGASTEEKRIVMMAVKKIAKYRNVPLDYAVGDVMRVTQELERDIKKGKVK